MRLRPPSSIRKKLFLDHRKSNPVDRSRIHLVTCIGTGYESRLLPYYLAHYQTLGVPAENFHIVVNAATVPDDAERKALDVLDRFHVKAEEIWREAYTSELMWQKRRDVQRRCVPARHWVISADLDEFHEYPMALSEFLGECEANAVNCVDGVFIDRISQTGELAELPETASLDTCFPHEAMVQGQAVGYGRHHHAVGSIKVMAFDAELLPKRGGHGFVQERGKARFLGGRSVSAFPGINTPFVRFRIPLRVHHYKWHAGLLATLRQRVATPGVSAAGAEYANALFGYFDTHANGIDINAIPVAESSGMKRGPLSWRDTIRLMRGQHLLRLAASRGKHTMLARRDRLRTSLARFRGP